MEKGTGDGGTREKEPIGVGRLEEVGRQGAAERGKQLASVLGRELLNATVRVGLRRLLDHWHLWV